MTLDLTGKVAVVSGSTSGIGQGIAAGLAKAGVTVVIVGRKQRGVDDAIAAIAAQTPTASLRGVVADLSTEDGVAIPGDMINYGVTKAANLAVSHGLAKRLAGTGVTVNAILPGPTFTDGLKEMLADAAAQPGRCAREQADEFVKTSRPSSIIQRAADVEEVANLAVYLASPLSSATTGAALRVDGGVVDTLTM
ncbi:TPA: SDR family oxidoreductase [Escherichia coli]|uniref:SDR family NAD(P)-dependent oxidoreductase n=1 Tax=Escherichia coli TaxID=562 RepID=UPI000F09D396|nr:SDR family oxidoreductase [Escherichia coli]EFM8969250.1 SDR family oxidoreductase [Escherichia coli]EFN7369859.1 SDR family oxidoreductase [Escherichia coli]MBB9319117.1 SDR family oxidoreductase [Escherichia coli]MBC1059886.1 SDR family oxidoreductase [Escherichia coli]